MQGRKGCCLPDKGVDLDGVNIVELLEGSLNLTLVGLDVDDEDEGVVFLDLLHGALGVQGVENNLVGVKCGLAGNRHARVLGRPGELEGLGAVESGRGANLAGLVKLSPPDLSVSGAELMRVEGRSRTYGRALHDCLGGSISPGGGACACIESS